MKHAITSLNLSKAINVDPFQVGGRSFYRTPEKEASIYILPMSAFHTTFGF
jgi:hypothetical protein